MLNHFPKMHFHNIETDLLNKIFTKFGKPIIFIPSEKLCRLKEGILDEKDWSSLGIEAKGFYEQWDEYVNKKYKNGNSTSACLTCYTFIKKGAKVIILFEFQYLL